MRSFLSIFPDGFLGMAATNATRRILLYGATYSNNSKLCNQYCEHRGNRGTHDAQIWQVGCTMNTKETFFKHENYVLDTAIWICCLL